MEQPACNTLKAILSEAGVQNYEPEVLSHLSDYLDRYIDEVFEKSKNYMQHAGRTELNASDVKLALNEMKKQEANCRLNWSKLIALAKEHNKTNLPVIKERCGLQIPNSALNGVNYRMKGLHTNNQTHFPYSITHHPALNEIITNNARNPTGINAIIRKFTGNPSINLNPQHIIFKQQIPGRKSTENVEDLAFKKRKTI